MRMDLLQQYRDDDGRVRMHRHTTRVQKVRITRLHPEEYFPTCDRCGPLTPNNFPERAEAWEIASEHTRNSGIIVPGF